MDERPLGIFDSGSGGLTLWKSIRDQLPKESIVYVGDQRNMPYGTKTHACIKERGKKIISFLLSKNCKLIVVACNTATVAGIEYFRACYPRVPIVGVVPVIKTAGEKSKTKKILILSTPSTSKSTYLKKLIHTYASDCKVFSVGAASLVQYVEEGIFDGEKLHVYLKQLLDKPIRAGIDCLVLGCTHFPFVTPVLKHIVGETVVILDSGMAVARQVDRIINHNTIQSQTPDPSHTFYTTGDARRVSQVTQKLLHRPVVVEHIDC